MLKYVLHAWTIIHSATSHTPSLAPPPVTGNKGSCLLFVSTGAVSRPNCPVYVRLPVIGAGRTWHLECEQSPGVLQPEMAANVSFQECSRYLY